MNWLTSFSFALLLLSQYVTVESRKGPSFGSPSKSPWTNPIKANAFMKCLIQKIAQSPVFPQQEKEDMESIVETMMSAITSMSNSRSTSSATLQAMNMAFASSMAELVIAEDADNQEGIAVKTDALSKALKQCFIATIGSVNRQFIAEIKDLIVMFAKEASEDTGDNEIEVEVYEPDRAMGGVQTLTQQYPTGISTAAETQQLTEVMSDISKDFQAGYEAISKPGTDYGVPSAATVPSGVVSTIANNLASAFLRSNVFQRAFNSRLSSSVANRIAAALAQSIASSLQLDYGTASKCKNAIMQAFSGIRSGSDTRVYALSIASTLAAQLAAAGLLNASNVSSLGSTILSGVVKGTYSGARQAGVDMSGVDLSSDVSSSISAYGAGPAVALEVAVTPQFPESISDISQGISARPEGIASPSVDYGALSGSAVPSGVISDVANNVASALLRSNVFQRAFNARVSSSIANRIAPVLAQSIASSLQLDYGTASKCRNAIMQALSSIRNGSDTRDYALAIASSLAAQLAAAGRLNSSNASSIGTNILSGVLQGAYSGARQAGVDVSGVDVTTDISSSISTYGAGPEAAQKTAVSGQYPQGISDISQDISGVSEGITGPGADYGAPTSGAAPPPFVSDVANNIASALLRSNVFQRAFNARASTSIANRIGAALAQSIASNLQLDYGTASKCRSAVMQALSTVRSGSDTRVYALAIASALASQLAAAGRLNVSNASGIGSSLLSGVLQGAYSGARQAGIDLSGVDVSSDISSSISAYGAVGTVSQVTALPSQFPQGISDISQGILGVSEGIPGTATDYGVPSGDAVPSGLISDVVNNLASALLRSNIFQRAFNARVSSSVANRIAASLAQSIPSSLQLDYGTADKCKSAIMQAISGVRNGSETRVYALTIASALASQLATAGRITAANASGIGPSLLSGIVQGTYSGARQAGVDVSGMDVSSDISSSISAFGAGPTAAQVAAATPQLTESISGTSQGISVVSEGIKAPGLDYGEPSSGAPPSGVISDIANNLASALLRSNTFQRAFNARVSSSVANTIAAALAQSITSSLQLDYATASKCRNAIMQALSGVRRGSDTRVFALAIASALVSQLAAVGRLNASNASSIGSSLLSGVVQGAYSGARQAGVDVSGLDVSSDISSSISAYGAGSTTGQDITAAQQTTAGISDISQGVSGVSGVMGGPGADYGVPTGGAVPSAVISDVANKLASALLRSNIFQRAFNARVSPSVANRIATALAQSIASGLQLDYGTASKCRNAIMQALSAVRSGSDTSVYALAVASALVSQLASAGRLNASNASNIGSSLLSRVVQGAYSGARQAGVDVSGIDVSSDISSSISAYASVPTDGQDITGIQQTTAGETDISQAVSGITGPGGDYGAPASGALPSGVLSDVANNLASALLRSNVFTRAFNARVSASVANRIATALAQSVASGLQLDYGTASNCRNAIMQALSGVRSGSDTSVYALAVASALVSQLASAGRLNASNASNIGSSLLSGVVQGAYSGARQAGVDVSGIDVSSDISSSISAYGSVPTAGQDITGIQQTTAGVLDISQSVSGITGPGGDYGAPASGALPSAVTSDLAKNLSSALLRSNVFKRAFNARVSSSIANRIAAVLAQSISSSLQLDYGIASKCRNAIMQAVSGVRTGSDTRVYAMAIASALASQLAAAGRLSASNASSIGSSLLASVVEGAYSGARQSGVDVSGVNISSDISFSISGYGGESTTGQDISAAQQITAGISDIAESVSGVSELMGGPGEDYGAPSGGALPSGAISDVANNLASALLRSNIFQRAFNARLTSSVANRIAAVLAQSIASSLQLDYGTASKCRNAIMQALSGLRRGSDTRVYALAIASALTSQLAAAGRLNASNASSIISSLLSGVVQGAYSGARQAGVDVAGVDVSSDISSSISAYGAGPTRDQEAGVSSVLAGSISDISQELTAIPEGITGPGTDYGAPSAAAVPSNIISDVANNLASALCRSNVFQRAFNARVSSSVANRIATVLAQSIASTLQLDYVSASKSRNAIMQALSGIKSGSDTRIYALAITSALAAQLAAAGRLTTSNASDIGSSLLPAIVQGAYSGARQNGVDVSGVDIRSDISASVSAYSSGTSPSQISSVSLPLPEGFSPGLSEISRDITGGSEGISESAVGFGGLSPDLSVSSAPFTLPAALRSPDVASRVNSLTSSIVSSIGPKGVDMNAFGSRLVANISNMLNSGASASEAVVETLIETIAALLQVVSSAQIRSVNTSSTSFVVGNLARALSSVSG